MSKDSQNPLKSKLSYYRIVLFVTLMSLLLHNSVGCVFFVSSLHWSLMISNFFWGEGVERNFYVIILICTTVEIHLKCSILWSKILHNYYKPALKRISLTYSLQPLTISDKYILFQSDFNIVKLGGRLFGYTMHNSLANVYTCILRNEAHCLLHFCCVSSFKNMSLQYLHHIKINALLFWYFLVCILITDIFWNRSIVCAMYSNVLLKQFNQFLLVLI